MPLHSGITVDLMYLLKTYYEEMLISLLNSVYRYKNVKEEGIRRLLIRTLTNATSRILSNRVRIT